MLIAAPLHVLSFDELLHAPSEDLYLHLDRMRLPLGVFYLATLKHFGYKEERTKGLKEQSLALPVE